MFIKITLSPKAKFGFLLYKKMECKNNHIPVVQLKKLNHKLAITWTQTTVFKYKNKYTQT